MTTRDVRIDVLRGIAMITILINHFGDPAKYFFGFEGPLIPTPTKLGYSSAASLFVAMSGYMIGMVYLHRNNPISLLMQRALKLYLVNLIILAAIAPMAMLTDQAHDFFWQLEPLKQHPIVATFKFLTFQYAPVYLNVLQLYIALLVMTPIAVLLARVSPLLMAACSVLLWTAMQILPSLLYGDQLSFTDNGPSFHVLAWQIAFFVPMAAGTLRIHEWMFSWFREKPIVLLSILAMLALFAVARLLHAETIIPAGEWLTNRRYHAPIWTLHALMTLCAYVGVLAWLSPYMHYLLFRILASLGRNSLAVFATSIPLTYLLLIAFDKLKPGYPGYWIGIAILLIVSWANAYWADRKLALRKAKGAQPTPSSRSYPQPA